MTSPYSRSQKNVYRLHALKNPPKGVSFSEFIRTFAMPFRVDTQTWQNPEQLSVTRK